MWMDQVARAVLILGLTDNSPLMLSLVIATRLVPILLFGLLAGAIADRSDKKRMLTLCQAVTFGTHVFLGVVIVTGVIEVWMVFATALVAGTAMAFNQPVRQSLIPMTVPREDLMNAVALNSTALSFMRIGGGSIAGVLLITFDVGGVYLIIAAVYTLVILTTQMMRFPPREKSNKPKTSLVADLAEGFAYIKRTPNLTLVTSLALVIFLFGMPYQQVYVPLMAKQTLDLGDSGVGFLQGCTGVGAVIGSLIVAWKGNVRRPGVQLLINLVIFGVALVGMSLQSTVIGAAVFLALAGSMTVTYMAYTNGILLENSDPEMHGRVMSLMSLDRGLIPLGAITSGLLVSNLGVRPGLFVQGLAILIVTGVAILVAGRRLALVRSGSPVRGHGRRAEASAPVADSPGPQVADRPSPIA